MNAFITIAILFCLFHLWLNRFPTSIRKKSDPWQTKSFYQRWARRMDRENNR
jgi:hypothetical protein